MHRLPVTVLAPLPEVVVDGALGRELPRQEGPLTASAQHVEDGIDHFPHLGGARAAARLGGRDQFPDLLPLGIGQVAGVSLAFHTRVVSPLPLSGQALSRWVTYGLRFTSAQGPMGVAGTAADAGRVMAGGGGGATRLACRARTNQARPMATKSIGPGR